MRKLFILCILSFLLLTHVHPQSSPSPSASFTPSMKYGKPSDEELNMTTYAPDTAASAVVLYSKVRARYDLVANEFRLTYNYEVKIKVLKSEGTSYADINIPFYSNVSNASMKESVNQIDACAYNLEDGKVVRTKMKRDLIFDERINKKYEQIKFSIPAVRAGTVFEYKYQIISDFYYNINHWEAQRDIPVVNTQYDIVIPEYFVFNLDMRGGHALHAKDETETLSFNIQYQNGRIELVSCTGRHLRFIGENLPALRADSYVWCPDDYRSGVGFELRGINFPGSIYKSFTRTWRDIDEMLLADDEFGSPLKMRNPFRDDMAALSLDRLTDRQEKICAIFTFLKNKISWNGQYGIYGSEVRKAVKNGTGSNADINFVLMSMLRDAKIPCYPVVMSRKTAGILPYTHPSVQKLNTFIVGIADTDSTFVFLDGSVTDGYLNTLPPVLMVDRARLITHLGDDNWVDLSHLGKNTLRSVVNASITADGTITGSRQAGYSGQYAAMFRKRYRTAKDSAEFISNIETEENIKVQQFSTKDVNSFSPKVTETLFFEKQASVNDNLIYVNPMIFLHVSKCPFIQTERHLPLEMPYTEQLMQVTQLTIPEGYVVDELPESMNMQTEDQQGYCRYNIQQQGNQVVIRYTFAYNKLLHTADEYKAVKSFWELVAQKNNEIVVLKKL